MVRVEQVPGPRLTPKPKPKPSTSARVGTPWRRGRSVGRTIYNADETLIGVMDTPELAALVVDAVNSWAHQSDTRHTAGDDGR